MSKIEMLSTTKVGNLIAKAVSTAAKGGQIVHEAAIQCALHIRDNGDTSLAQRLCKELREHAEGAAAINVPGLEFWFGQACPMTVRDGVWKLLDKDSTTYAKYVERLLKATTDKAHENGQPDEIVGPGGRVFFVDYCSEHPFWNMDDVRKQQQAPIRVIGLKQMFKQAYAIKTNIRKAIDEGKFAGDPAIASSFLDKLTSMTDAFMKETSTAVALAGEDREVEKLKEKLEAGAEELEQSPAPDVGGLNTDEPTTGEESTEDQESNVDATRTGTEG